MRNLFSQLWADDNGIVSLEYLVLATILGLGLIVGVTALTAVMVSEYDELASAIGGLSQNYASSGFSNCVANHAGSGADSDVVSPISATNTAPASNPIDDAPCS